MKSESDYYPWGGELSMSNSDPNHYKFTGKEHDTESGLDYFGARFYSASMGRFMTPDWAEKPATVPYAEFGDPQSLNLYSYVRNSPVARVDTDGHMAVMFTSAGDGVGWVGGYGTSFNSDGLSSPDSPLKSISDTNPSEAPSVQSLLGFDPGDIDMPNKPTIIEAGNWHIRPDGPQWDPGGLNKKKVLAQHFQDDKKIYEYAASIATDPMRFGGSPAFPFMVQVMELENYVVTIDAVLNGSELLEAIQSIPGAKEAIGNAGENDPNKVMNVARGNVSDVLETLRIQFNAQVDALIGQANQAIMAAMQ